MIENKEGRSQFIVRISYPSDAQFTPTQYQVLLNNLDVSCEYILKLAKDVDLDTAFKDHPESLAKIRSALSSMNEEAASFRNVLRVICV